MMKFERRTLKGALPRPDWWLVRPDEIGKICESVKRGKCEVLAHTPGGFPVYAVTYGEPKQARELNWPSATGSPHPEYYAGTGPQTVMFIAGVHGEEPEGVITLLNLISLMETGKDLRGVPNPEMVRLAEKFRLVLMPCVNMDGRAISPDCYVGAQFEDFADIVYTRLKDGTQLRWPQLKEYYPMPMDRVAQLGTYYNSEGYNIQLDSAPGNIYTAEAKAVFQLAHRERADIFINLHSDGHEHIIVPSRMQYAENIATVRAIRKIWLGLRGYPADLDEPTSKQADLDQAVTMATGAAAFTFEFGLTEAKEHAALLGEGYSLLEAVFRHGQDHLFADRVKILEN